MGSLERTAAAVDFSCGRTSRGAAAAQRHYVMWERLRKQNHWFDALYNACAAGHGVGVRLVAEVVPEQPKRDSWFNDPDRKKRQWVDWEELRNRYRQMACERD